MKRALIGDTGFVGSNLARAGDYAQFYNSRNIESMRGAWFDEVVCAGVQAKKWWANLHPEDDWAGIERLLDVLKTVRAKSFILISTVDVYPQPKDVDEETTIDPATNHAYGKHRFLVEQFVRERFPETLTVRLPGLFGTGIKKNVIHDLLTNHELEKINPGGVFQYYFLDHLDADLKRAGKLGISLLNLSSEPLATREILDRFFPGTTIGPESEFQSAYDMKSLHWEAWDSDRAGYLYTREQVLADLERFVNRESA